ncbi:MAG: hypothetical protein ACLQUY_24695 [Ktedonobacterales bacterium]
MIDWTEELMTQIEAFSRVALSYTDSDGYPVVLPLPLTFDRDTRCFTLLPPNQRPVPASDEQVSLTLLRYDEPMKMERYLLFYGQLTETGNEWIFTPLQVVLPQWGRRA